MNDSSLGSVLFTLPVGLLVSLPLSGWMVSRFGSRRLAIVSVISYALILPLIGLATQVWQLVVVLFFFGLASNLVNISVNTQAVAVESLYQRSIMSAFHGLWSLAGFCSASIATMFIALHLSVWQHFSISCIFALLLLSIAYRFLLSEDVKTSGSEEAKPLFAMPDKHLFLLGLIAFCGMICEGTMFDWSGIYFARVVQAPSAITTLGYTVFMSTMAGGRFVGDLLATKLGTFRIIQLNGVLISTGYFLAVAFPTIVPATIGFLIIGLGVSTIVPLIYGAAGKSQTMPPSMALASVSTISFVGFLLGPPMVGFISEATSLRGSFSVVAILGILTTVLASVVKQRVKRQKAA